MRLSDEEAAQFNLPNILSPRSSRDATNAPEYLYNLYLTYDLALTGTKIGLFYTVTGDTLVAGAGQSEGNLVPDVYAKAFDTLNLTLTQRLTDSLTVEFKARNLTDPKIETEYRPLNAGDRLKSSRALGIDYAIGLSAEIRF